MARVKKMDISMKGITRMLYILNIVFLLIGIFLTALGSTIHAVYSEFEFFIDTHYFKPVDLLISVGVIMMVISFIGFMGTAKKSTMLVKLYALLLFILFIFECSLAIVGFVMNSTIFMDIKSNMDEALNHYNEHAYVRDSWNFMQERLHCCGVYSPYNWAVTDVDGPEIALGDYRFTVPQSCCTDLECNEVYARGCVTVLGKYASDSIISITCCSIFVLLIQIFGVIFACKLAQGIRRAKTDEEMRRQQNRQMIFDKLVNEHQGKVITPVLYTPSSTEA